MSFQASLFGRLRPERQPVSDRFVVALRWAVTPGFGLGTECYSVWRTIDHGIAEQIYPLAGMPLVGAPGAKRDGQQGWIIDAEALRNAAQERSSTPVGLNMLPRFAPGTLVEDMSALLLYALNDPCFAELDKQLETIIERLGGSHRSDTKLARRFWPGAPPPTRADLLDWKASGERANVARYRAVRRFYRRDARKRIEAMTLDYGFAAFAGLGVDNLLPAGTPQAAEINYSLRFGAAQIEIASRRVDLYERSLAPPRNVTASPTKGLVGHKMFKGHLGRGGRWSPPDAEPLAAAGLVELADRVRGSALGKRAHSNTAVISWTPAPSDGDRVAPTGPRPRAMTLDDPVFWRVERYCFPDSADLPPPSQVPPGADYEICMPDERFGINRLADGSIARGELVDDQSRDYGKPAMIGWFAYRVRGIDLFGIAGHPSDPDAPPGGVSPAITLLLDDVAPDPPRIQGIDRIDYQTGDRSVTVDCDIDWGHDLEFAAPDTVDFALFARWRRLSTSAFEIVRSERIAGADGHLRARVALRRSGDPAVIPHDELVAIIGERLIVDGKSFLIRAANPGAGYSLTVARSKGENPPIGPAYASTISPTVFATATRHMPRNPAIPVELRLVSMHELHFAISTRDPVAPITSARLYVHVLGLSLPGRLDASGRFDVNRDALAPHETRILGQWQSLGAMRAKSLIKASPGLVLPSHRISWLLDLPPGFSSGALDIDATAFDDAFYVHGPNGAGHESIRSATMTCLVLCATPPGKPQKVRTFWAQGGGQYEPHALVTLRWDAVAGAKRYEVDYVLDTRLGLAAGCSDEALIAAARAAPDTMFVRRTNGALTHGWTDTTIPGQAPTRLVYRVRAISEADRPGEWSVVALVRVPDVRIAPPPSLSPPQAIHDRALRLQWTQAGDLTGLGFRIDVRIAPEGAADSEQGWRTVADYLPSMLKPARGALFETELIDLAPGTLWQVRLCAVRHALDPIDPLARITRRVDGYVSNFQTGLTTGELRPPANLVARRASTGSVALSWSNPDPYAALELQIRKPGARNFERIALRPDQDGHHFTPGGAPGRWAFRLLASARGVNSLSAIVEVDL
ncbi:hypothetical protein [Sphingomonas sp. BK345]|uniref:hypothetical protein n=1 Tax=Sphingomonas sp. BK345 TaxID=2586980 RepID=UPI00161F04E1|nr:hypothetical protein [Sphingomonas sp. BK345]MBB3472779.1 hypothetical protein [Sphingomonas sp. BK345]